MKSSDIARVTQSNHRTINRALRLSRLTGSVIQKPLQTGCPRQLTPHCDVKVSLMCHWKSTTLLSQYLEARVEHASDMYMHELQHALREARNVDVSVSTIHRILCRHGYSRKMVD
jgi:hypothetical protein